MPHPPKKIKKIKKYYSKTYKVNGKKLWSQTTSVFINIIYATYKTIF